MLHVITQAQIWKSFWVENLTSLFNLYPFLHRLKLGKSLQNMLCPRLSSKTTYKPACIPSTVTYMYLQLFNKYSTGVHWIWDGRLQTRHVVTSWLSSHIQQAWVEWAIPENIHTIPRTAFRISEGDGGSRLWNFEGMGGIYDWKSEGIGEFHRWDFWSRKCRMMSEFLENAIVVDFCSS